ncbi:diadenylate cyclase [Hymenobacter bucti]|uniref:Diadenylate cyclase n=1 Tax=Hymenobacter bucti TaxID=1844114 RepID=A0ABW4QPB9_9BACT
MSYLEVATVPVTFRIWSHERRYRNAAQAIAQALFDALDDELEPQVLLLGLPLDTSQPIVQEAGPDGTELPTELLADVAERGRSLALMGQVPVATTPIDNALDPADLRDRLERKGVRMALQPVLNELAAGTDYEYFSTWPIVLNNYYVCTILRVQRRPLQAYPALRPDRAYTDGRPLPNSLLVAAMSRFNEETVKALTEPEPGAGLLYRPRDTEELLRAAGRSLLDAPALAVGSADWSSGERLDWGSSTGPGAERLFYIINTISSLRYEGAEGVGCLLLARRGHPNLEEVFALTCPVDLTDYRAVRKLLEMTTPGIHLLADADKVYALGREVGHYDAAREDLFAFHFVTYYTWEFSHAGHTLVRCRYGLPGLARPRLNRLAFKREYKRTFGVPKAEELERMWQVVLEASRQPKGTLLVVSTEALAEADRLKLQCTLIEPVVLTPIITQLVTAIDGAVMLDPQGYCYSIGVILDGTASGRGNSTRGARYNSAIRYVESSPYPTLVVVVSEDGMVDVMTKASLAESRV